MSSPGLKPTVELRSAGPQPELVDAATSRAVVLSPLEARLLGLWDGICSASHLTDVARAHGLVIEGRQAAVFLERLSRAGFLAAPPTIDSGLVPDAPGLERLEDRAPKLRGDLLIEKPAGAKGVLRVTDPLKSRSFTLYDFEISIARLLDGRRTAGDVIDAANRLGIPVNLESLRKFVRQLRGYRFIDERAVAPSEPAEATPSLDTWTPEQREMYESALRFWKQEKLAEAIEYLSALLEVNPDLQEPAELKARLEAERAGEANVDLNFDSLHGVVNPLAAADAAPAAMTVPDFVAVSPSPAAARPSKPSGRSPAVPAPAPSPSRPLAEAAVTDPDVLALHASPAPPAKPSRPSARVPAVPGELPSPKPSRPTGELPAVPAPKPSKPSERVPAVPAPAPSPSRLPPAAGSDFLTLHASLAPGARPSPKPSRPTGELPAVPAPKPSKPSERVPAVPGELPSPKPSRPTGELPAVPAPKPSKPSERVPAVPAPAPSPSRPPPAADPDFLTLHASPAPGAGPSPKPSRPTGELPAVPAPKPSKPSERVAAVPAPALSPSRPTGELPAVPAPKPSKPSERVPAVPVPAPSPSRPPPADPDFLTLHASPPPGAGPSPTPSTPTDAPSPAREVPFSTPSQMLSHDEDPFRLYERGVVMTADVPHADVALPRPSTPSIIIDEDAGPAAAPSPAPPESAPAQPAPPDSATAQPASPESAPAKVPFTSSPSLEQFLAENAVPEARTYDDAAVDAAAVDAAALGLARKRPRWLLPAIAGVAVLALVGAGAWLLRPVPRHFSAPAKLTAVAPQPVTALRAGDVGPHAVEDGAMVKAGQPLGALDDAAPKKRLADIEKRRAAIDRRRAALVPAAEKKVKPAAKKAELARKVYAAAAKKLERAEALPPAKRKAAVAKAKKAEAAAKTKLKKAEAALEALTHDGELQKLAAETTALETEAAALGEALATPPFTAPIAGRLTWLKAAGDAVQPGDVVAQVDPGQWKVHADVHVTLPPGIPVEATVAVGGAALELRKLRVTDAAVDGVVESTKPLAATGTVELSAGERHAWELLVGSD